MKRSTKRPKESLIRKGLAEVLPTPVQKNYHTLSDIERDVLNTALEKYRTGQSEPILVGDAKALKSALRLLRICRLVIEELKDGASTTSYTQVLKNLSPT
jgi:hypothetical protein